MFERLLVTRLSEDAKMPSRSHPTDAGLDLASVEEIRLAPGERKMVRTDIAVAIPEGSAGFVTPRSGLAAKHGISITNSPGIIDTTYRGHVMVILENLGDVEFFAPKGDRIAQLLLVPISLVEPEEVDSLDETDRGAGGFGSTGS